MVDLCMGRTAKGVQEVRDLFYPVLGDVKYKNYFSSYIGFFKNNILFALYKDGNLFLKFSDEFLPEIESISGAFQLKDLSLRINTDRFYYVMPDMYKEIENKSYWFNYISECKIKSNKKKFIRNLLNMNINLERLLYRNSIKTIEEFFFLGEINIFVKLIKNGEDVNEMFLFKLYAARMHKFVYNLDNNEKRTLLLEADIALYNAGLRKRFTSKY